MRNAIVYWGERALNEPYSPLPHAPLVQQYRHGMLGCGAVVLGAVLAFSVGSGMLRHWLFSPPQVAVFTLDDIVYQAPPPAPKAPAAPPVVAPAPTPFNPQAAKDKPAKPTVTTAPAATPKHTQPTAPAKHAPSTAVSAPAAPQAKPAPALPAQRPVAPAQPTTPAAPREKEVVVLRKLENDKESGKPVDIAPAEHFGIKELRPDGITIVSGQRFKVGQRLPNGELIQSIDTTKGIIETDRRTMVTQ